MAVKITDLCINCDACVEVCPVEAIVDDDSSPRDDWEYTYIKPEKCIECVGHAEQPACASECPTEGAIVWDLPYIADYNDHFVNSDEYAIRVHKKKGMLTPAIAPQPFRDDIPLEVRTSNEMVEV
jgi:ferredoxin